MSETKPLTNNLLKGVLTDTVMYRAANGNADDYLDNGLYAAVSGMLNLPEGSPKIGMLEVIGCWYCKIQRYTPTNPKDVLVYQRVWLKDKGWQEWYVLVENRGGGKTLPFNQLHNKEERRVA